MESNRVDTCLSEALEADDPSEKDYHVRQAKQLLCGVEDGEQSEPTPTTSKRPLNQS